MAAGVLITRPEAEAATTARRVAALGFTPVVAPVLRIAPRSPAIPASCQAVLVTSGNALPGLPDMTLPLFAVGDATAARARALGFATVMSAGRDAAALAALADQSLDPARGPVLVACGAGQGAALCAALRGAGFRVVRRVTYAAVPVAGFPQAGAVALRAGDVRAALFLSAETARVFARLLPPGLRAALQNVRAVAIGKPAADALHALPWREVRLARNPSLDDVLAQL